jgi:alpha-N-acetylglucosamine transferase
VAITEQQTIVHQLAIKAFPNPTNSQFNVQLLSNNNTDKVQLRVMDIQGRTVEMMHNLNAGQVVQIGAAYRPGIYIVEMIQGNNRKQVKLLKQPH